MYWKLVRWGGTAVVVVMIAIALLQVIGGPGTPQSSSQGSEGIKLN